MSKLINKKAPAGFSNLEPGDWILMEFGFCVYLFYVAEVTNKHIGVGKMDWLSTSVVWFSKHAQGYSQRSFEYVGSTKRKFYWKYLPKFLKAFTHPYYKIDLL